MVRLSASGPRVAFGLAASGLFFVLLLPPLFRSTPTPDVFAQAVHHYQTVTEGVLPIEYTMEDPQGLQARFNTSGRLDFTTQVLDLRPAGYHLRGERVVKTDGHLLAVALYEETGKEPIICLRQRGPLPPLPQGAAGKNGHYWYTAEGYTAMFTQFPDHFCIMISRQPEEMFLQRFAMTPGS